MKKIISVLGLFVGTFAFSQASEAKAREIIKITQADKIAISSMMLKIQELKKTSPDISEEFINEFISEVTPEKLIEIYAPIYVKYYTESEMDELIKFYKSSVGQKTISVVPSILRESMEAGSKLGRDIAIQVKEKLDKKAGYQSPPPPMPEKSK